MKIPDTGEAWHNSMGALQENPLRLRTLVLLRWLAVVGQLLAIMVVSIGLGFEVPLLPSLGVVAVSALLNIVLSLRWRPGHLLSRKAAGLQLAYDVVQLAVLLYLTGGLQNPFSFLFLVPVTVSASALSNRWTLLLGAIAFVSTSLLAVYHLPLPWRAGETFELPVTYVAGLWVAVLCATGFAALFAARIAEEASTMSAALSATELVLAREQRFSALDGLAAAAAHELGTPLATIALVAKEMKREMPGKSPHAEDVELLISQAARCREILAKLANHDQAADEIFGQRKVSSMIEDIVAPLRGSDVTITITCEPEQTGVAEPVLTRNPGISYGLSNILANAIDFAETSVTVRARWSASQLAITIEDDGPGFDQAIFGRLGDPYVTTRPGYDARPGGEDMDSPPEGASHDGMGLGLFIAKTLLERSGASVGLSNRNTPAHGAVVKLLWSRQAVDVSAAVAKTLDPKAMSLQ